jgi:hypothetical protein
MSKRRAFDDVVQVQGDEEAPPYLVKLIPTADGAQPNDCMNECGDAHCRE